MNAKGKIISVIALSTISSFAFAANGLNDAVDLGYVDAARSCVDCGSGAIVDKGYVASQPYCTNNNEFYLPVTSKVISSHNYIVYLTDTIKHQKTQRKTFTGAQLKGANYSNLLSIGGEAINANAIRLQLSDNELVFVGTCQN